MDTYQTPLLEADDARAHLAFTKPGSIAPLACGLAFYVSFTAACCVSLPVFTKIPLLWCAFLGPWLAMGHGLLPSVAGAAALHLSVLLAVPICMNRRACSYFMFTLAMGLWAMSGVFGGMLTASVAPTE